MDRYFNSIVTSSIPPVTLNGSLYVKSTGEPTSMPMSSLYLYAAARAERDRIADLHLRLIAGGGVGYQWFETPTFNLFTEAGLAWVYENFPDQPSEDHLALRLAYHVDWTPHKATTG